MQITKETARVLFDRVYGDPEEVFNEWWDDGDCHELAISRDDMGKFEGVVKRDYQVAKCLRRGTISSERQGEFWVVFFDGEGLCE